MPIRWGIIGCGDVARRRVAGAILGDPNSQLVAACRRDVVKLKQFCSDFGVAHEYENYQDLINNDELDAVYIATPVYLHLRQTIAAAEAGKHVLVEKPMAMSVAECDEMISACGEHDVKLGVAYYRRFYPVVDRIKEIIESGQIGQPLSISVTTATAFAIGPDDDGYWRVIPEQGGGGALMDIGSHRLNVMMHLFGEVADVSAFCNTVAADYSAEDAASMVMRFQSGVHGTLQCFFGTAMDPDELSVLGTKGRLRSATLNEGHLVIKCDGDDMVEQHPPHENFNSPLIADFVAAIQDNRPPKVDGEEGRTTNLVMERAYRRS